MTTLYANPYNTEAAGFYFADAAEFIGKMEGLTDPYGCPVEEFEIDFIDGDDAELFSACGINQANLDIWFDDIEPLDMHQKAALYWLIGEAGYNLGNAIDKIDDVSLHQGELLDAATELFDECYAYQIPDNLHCYIDYKAFARDCNYGGDMAEFQFAGNTWTVTNASGI